MKPEKERLEVTLVPLEDRFEWRPLLYAITKHIKILLLLLTIGIIAGIGLFFAKYDISNGLFPNNYSASIEIIRKLPAYENYISMHLNEITKEEIMDMLESMLKLIGKEDLIDHMTVKESSDATQVKKTISFTELPQDMQQIDSMGLFNELTEMLEKKLQEKYEEKLDTYLIEEDIGIEQFGEYICLDDFISKYIDRIIRMGRSLDIEYDYGEHAAILKKDALYFARKALYFPNLINDTGFAKENLQEKLNYYKLDHIFASDYIASIPLGSDYEGGDVDYYKAMMLDAAFFLKIGGWMYQVLAGEDVSTSSIEMPNKVVAAAYQKEVDNYLMDVQAYVEICNSKAKEKIYNIGGENSKVNFLGLVNTKNMNDRLFMLVAPSLLLLGAGYLVCLIKEIKKQETNM